LADSSWDAWIKFYRPDANSTNSSVSYYEKGMLVALLLDLRIRAATGNARSLDDVMRRLWADFEANGAGFEEGAVERIAAEVAGVELTAFFDLALRSTEDLPFHEILSAAGLLLRPAHEIPPGNPARTEVRTGLGFRTEGGRVTVATVSAESAGMRAGVNAGDELVALDGIRIAPETLAARLAERAHGDRVRLTLFRRDELLTVEMEIEMAPPARLSLRPAAPTPAQQALLDDWLRTDVPETPRIDPRVG
ncbi:MAG TPA: PDZ domain-containing protein, partial [Longimicrobium sp.]|nr:PDZ domain-containing protein [Longimicrobium sp.]